MNVSAATKHDFHFHNYFSFLKHFSFLQKKKISIQMKNTISKKLILHNRTTFPEQNFLILRKSSTLVNTYM